MDLTTWNIDSHKETMREAKREYKAEKMAKADNELESLTSSIPAPLKRTISRGKKTGAWLTTIPSELNGTGLSRDEWRDMLSVCYGIRPESSRTNVTAAGKREQLSTC